MRRISSFLLAGALTFVPGAMSLAADHLDAPGLTSPGGDARLDINDVFAFQAPGDAERTVLIMTVSPAAGVIGPTTFHPRGTYAFRIDEDGDAREDRVFRINFGEPDKDGTQRVRLRATPANARALPRNERGRTGETVELPGGMLLRTGLFDDPFFFDLQGFLGADGRGLCDGKENNFFVGLNTLAIVLEMPRSTFASNNIGVWATTSFDEDQVDRMGRPAINTVFIPNNPFEPVGTEASQKNFFNMGKPKHDPRDFRTEVVDTLEIFYGAGNATAGALADVLLPDILTFDTTSPAGFLNGRRLADDVIDAELGLVTNGIVTSDCVDNDSAFRTVFPYLAPAN